MDNILMMGFDLNKENIQLAKLLKNMGYDVSFHYLEKPGTVREEHLQALNQVGIHSFGNVLSQIDWDHLSKELKTHAIVIMDDQLSGTSAHDYARVYGRDVWCATVQKDITITCDILIKRGDKAICQTPVDMKQCIDLYQDGAIRYSTRAGESIDFASNYVVDDWGLPFFMIGYMVAWEQGIYVEEALKQGLSLAKWYQEKNPLEIKEIPSFQGIQVNIVE